MPFRATLSGLPLLPLAATLFISGCQTTPSTVSTGFNSPLNDPMASAPPITRGLDADGLRTLLTAELSGQRGDYRTASQGYLEASQRYPSPALAERATFAARFGDDPALMEASALRWRELAPQAETPNRLLATLSLQRGDWLDSLEQRLAIVQAGGNGEIASFADLAIAEQAPLRVLAQPLRRYLAQPGASEDTFYSDALLGSALMENALGNSVLAQHQLDDVLALEPEASAPWLAQARLALAAGNDARARQAAREGLSLSPDDVRFILILAQAEIHLNNLAAAEEQTNALLESHGGNQELRIGLAQLYLDEGHSEPAYRLLQPLIGQADVPDLAYFLLGAIAQSQGEVDNALLYYRQVSAGDEFLPSRASAAQMLIADDRLLDARAFLRIERMRHEAYFSDLVLLEMQLLEELGLSEDAAALLDRELTRTPDDIDLLYIRAMRAWEADDIAGMERDLRKIIQVEPENVTALNALGYTLVDLNLPGRLEEARDLLERAYEADPGNPAVLDSLGWLYFRLGQPEDALSWLESAFEQMPDQEVAAHLAEVLNALGRREDARRLLNQMLKPDREQPQIEDLLQRHPELMPDTIP